LYAGFITKKRVVKRAGIHQRFDMAAYRMVQPYLPADAFPPLPYILHFEGYNGPDGLNSKQGLRPKALREHNHDNPTHIYDPIADTGPLPLHIDHHYAGLVANLRSGDLVRAGFEASWMAHWIADGLTPAHHWPLDDRVAEAAATAAKALADGDITRFTAFIKRNWAIWGAKGHMTTHFNFEMGVAVGLLVFPLRPKFDEAELARARRLGPIGYFKEEARDIAGLSLYERFYKEGWNNDIASIVKNRIAPQTARAIGNIWLLAMLEADQQGVEELIAAQRSAAA
jgi:hypothetical protein